MKFDRLNFFVDLAFGHWVAGFCWRPAPHLPGTRQYISSFPTLYDYFQEMAEVAKEIAAQKEKEKEKLKKLEEKEKARQAAVHSASNPG